MNFSLNLEHKKGRRPGGNCESGIRTGQPIIQVRWPDLFGPKPQGRALWKKLHEVWSEPISWLPMPFQVIDPVERATVNCNLPEAQH